MVLGIVDLIKLFAILLQKKTKNKLCFHCVRASQFLTEYLSSLTSLKNYMQ
jgi:hypothetical protein